VDESRDDVAGHAEADGERLLRILVGRELQHAEVGVGPTHRPRADELDTRQAAVGIPLLLAEEAGAYKLKAEIFKVVFPATPIKKFLPSPMARHFFFQAGPMPKHPRQLEFILAK